MARDDPEEGAHAAYDPDPPSPDEKRRRKQTPSQTPYADGVRFLRDHGYPNLSFLSAFLDSDPRNRPKRAPGRPNPSRIVLVSFLENGEVRPQDLHGGAARIHRDEGDLVNVLRSELNGRRLQGTIGKVFLVEDLSPSTANCLGYALDVHPSFFAAHIRDTWMETRPELGNAPALPSIARNRNFFSLDYMSAVTLRPLRNLDSVYVHCTYNYRRRIDLASVDQNARVGMARRKISFWLDRESTPWRCIVLVDPEIGPRFRVGTTDGVHGYTERTLEVRPFQQGYISFIEPSIRLIGRGSYYRERNKDKLTPLDDLIHYWCQISRAQVNALRQPTMLSVMRPAFQIAASEFIVALEAMKASAGLQGYSVNMKSPPSKLEFYLNESTYMDRVLAARIRQIQAAKYVIRDEGDPVYADYDYLEGEMRDLRDTCAARLSSITTMISLLDSRLAGRLSWAALIFAPISYACSIFSMGGAYAPGDRLFWVYIIVAAFFVLIVLLILYTVPVILPVLRRRIRDLKSGYRHMDFRSSGGGPGGGEVYEKKGSKEIVRHEDEKAMVTEMPRASIF
jgi:hypothetical protein